MNPSTIQNQGFVLAVLVLADAVTGGAFARWSALVLAVIGLAHYLVLNCAYARSLHGGPRTVKRWEGDRIVGTSGLLIGGLSVSGALYLVLAEPAWLRHTEIEHLPEVVGFTALLASAAIYWSSLTDWYWVLPRRDGVTRKPPCHEDTSEDQRKLLTRIWLYHRTLAAVAFAIATISALIGVLAVLDHWLPETAYNDLFVSTVAVPVTIAAIPLLPWLRGMIELMPSLGSDFRAKVGDFVGIRRDGVTEIALVHDVSLDKGYKLVPADPNEGAFTVHFADRSATDASASARPLRCAGDICGGWDVGDSCQWGVARIDRSLPTELPRAKPPKSNASHRFFVV